MRLREDHQFPSFHVNQPQGTFWWVHECSPTVQSSSLLCAVTGILPVRALVDVPLFPSVTHLSFLSQSRPLGLTAIPPKSWTSFLEIGRLRSEPAWALRVNSEPQAFERHTEKIHTSGECKEAKPFLIKARLRSSHHLESTVSSLRD